MDPLLAAALRPLDWVILLGYFVLLALTGWWFSRREPTGDREYFLAGRQMPMWAVAISVLATATSAATFIGAPEEAYRRDLTYLSANIGTILAVIVVAVFFIPAYYRHNVTTVYDLLETRFGRPAKQAASWTFMIGRIFASGSRLFISAIPLSLILFRDTDASHLLPAIAILAAAAILYTLVGGIRSIIWTDVIQAAVWVGAATAALVVLLSRIPVPLSQVIGELAATPAPAGPGSKLTVIRSGVDLSRPGLGFDPSQVYTLLTAIFGFLLLNTASYGTDHDLAQRMLTCRSAVKGSQSVLVAVALNIPVTALFMSIGLLLFVFYQRPDLMGPAAPAAGPTSDREVFLNFILQEMPAGLTGLMMAGLFAAGLGSCNSALNAMSAALINDWYRPRRPGRTDRHYLLAGRWGVVGWGVVLGVFASACVFWQQGSGQTLIQFALSVMSFAYAGLLGVFITAIFTRRGNNTSAILALAAGFAVVTLMQPWLFRHWASLLPGPGSAASLAEVKIAFPWHLLIGTVIATLICCSGRPRTVTSAHA